MPHIPTIFDFIDAHPALSTLVVTLLVMALIALFVNRSLARDEGIVPSERLTLRNFLELLMEGMGSQMEAAIGPEWRRFVPIVYTLGLFILISNITGLVPFFTGPTSFVETNLAWAMIAFVVYNIVGIQEHGLGPYLKRFAGPIPLLAPLMFPIELISNMARLLSLTVRLTANMFADHTLVAIFISFPIIGFVVPWAMMGLGLFVAFLQAFIFAYLTTSYIAQALEEAH